MLECPNKECMSAGVGAWDVFCYKCGAKLVIRGVCECGYEFCKVDIYCPICGKKKEMENEPGIRNT
jgi:hypothetical protein